MLSFNLLKNLDCEIPQYNANEQYDRALSTVRKKIASASVVEIVFSEETLASSIVTF